MNVHPLETLDGVPPLWFFGACGVILLILAVTERFVTRRGER